jgi:acetoacetyl-CoA synthetase
MNPIIWQPTQERLENSALFRFMTEQGHHDYAEHYQWSIDNREDFWRALIGFCDVRFHKEAETILVQDGDMTTAQWFAGGELNFAEHLLRHRGDRAAMIFVGENGARRELSFDQLYSEVARAAAGLRAAGVVKGDRVGGFLPNCPEAIVAMLAASSIGAIWSSCSPDFGINGVVDRFGQIEPKVLVCADGYFYNGKRFDSLKAVHGVLQAIPSIQQTVIIPFSDTLPPLNGLRNAISWAEFTSEDAPLKFESLPIEQQR